MVYTAVTCEPPSNIKTSLVGRDAYYFIIPLFTSRAITTLLNPCILRMLIRIARI